MHDGSGVLIHLITDRRRLCPGDGTERAFVAALEQQVEEAALHSVSVVQVRERDLDARPLARLVRALQRRVADSGTILVVNDRADVALAAGAGGVHLRGDGPAASRVRGMGPERWTIGRSIHSANDVAGHQDADYLLFGTTFPSTSKPGLAGQGAEALALAVKAGSRPLLAIGGITPERAERCARAGAAGVAAIGLFLPAGLEPGALGVCEGVVALRAAFDRGRSAHVQ